MVRLALAPLLLVGCVQAFELDDPIVDDDDPPGGGSGSGSGSGSVTCGSGASASQTAGGTCYERFNERITWYVARDRCAGRGGMLVKSESMDARTVLFSMIGLSESLHLGASDEAVPGTYRWLDGTDVVFPGWLVGEPDGANGAHCMVLMSSFGIGYNDTACSELLPYVCQRPL